jgi:hypothetical protein
LDDSQAALIPTGGNRKKNCTSYKRPGPPTPVKGGGRQSIGGPTELGYTNILKESNSYDVAKKTPGRFRMFGGNSKKADEVSSFFLLSEWG